LSSSDTLALEGTAGGPVEQSLLVLWFRQWKQKWLPKLGVVSSENRILLLVILIISLALLVVAFVISNWYQSSMDENYERFGGLIAKVVAVGGADRMTATLSPELKVKAFAEEMLQVSEDVAAIVFYDTNNKLMFTTQRNLPDNVMAHVLDFSAPVVGMKDSGYGKRNLGVVHVKLTGKTMHDIEAATKTIVLLIFISAWFISILAVSFNTYVLSKHLRTLVRGVKRLSSGDFGYKISENDLWGELRILAQSFNDMSARLRVYEAQNLDTITFERNKMEAVLLSIADGVVVCDNAGLVVMMNDSACQMLGVKTHHVLMGSAIKDYMTVDGKRCFAGLIQEFDTEEANALPIIIKASGKRPVSPMVLSGGMASFSRQVEMPGLALKVIISSIRDAEHNKLGFVMIMHDITKEMEVDKLKTNFISNVSHELRTPVTTIKSYIDTLCNHAEDLDQETYQEFMQTVNVETDRLKKLVNDILDFSRLEEGGVKLDMERQDIGPIINLTTQSLKVLAQQKDITLSTAIESNLPRLLINSDSIERVLRNLISNAIKYTDPGGRIKVRAELTRAVLNHTDALAPPEECVEVSVQDTGIGIPEEHLPFIFDRFYRVENKVHTVRGTGLGLHLVKIAVEDHHGGMVFVKSQISQGSTFGFRLPLQGPMADDESA
jgi:two-component system, OmpR family, sensor histidine kinase NblS